ncbi:MAG TPA: DUF1735 domain-containing protein [Arachidicoccus sp.]|nr:DUF1735 domain-containing protein [Arachidicoccus sp.]
MKKILGLILIAVGLLAACQRDSLDIPDASGYTSIYMPQAHNNPLAQNLYVVDTPLFVHYSAYFGGPTKPSGAITIHFKVDQALVDSFNLLNGTDYPVMPAGSYDLVDSVATIPAGTLSTAQLNLKLMTAGHIEVDKFYLLPITIASVSGDYKINPALRTQYFLFTGGYAPGEIIDWKDYDQIVPLGKYWLARKVETGGKKSLWAFPTDAGDNFGPGKLVGDGDRWQDYDMLFNYQNALMARKPNGDLYRFDLGSDGTLGAGQKKSEGWNIFTQLTGYGQTILGINTVDKGLWMYPVDEGGNIQPGRQVGQGWDGVSTLLPQSGAVIGRIGPVLTRFPLDENGNFDYGNIKNIGASTDWSSFNLLVWNKNAIIARKASGQLLRYPVAADGTVGTPVQIGQ